MRLKRSGALREGNPADLNQCSQSRQASLWRTFNQPCRITGDRRLGASRGAGYEKTHVAIEDATRLAYVEVLLDEKQATTVGFLQRAVAWFDSQGISCRRVLFDNGNA